jgi:hypothetical protein
MNFKVYCINIMLDIVVNLTGVYVHPSLLHSIIFFFFLWYVRGQPAEHNGRSYGYVQQIPGLLISWISSLNQGAGVAQLV